MNGPAQQEPAVLPPSPPYTPIRGVPMPSPPSLPRAKSCSPPQSPPPEQMTQQDWEEVYEIEYQWAEERYQSFIPKIPKIPKFIEMAAFKRDFC